MLTNAGWTAVVRAAPGHVRAVRKYVLDPLTTEQTCALQDIGGLIERQIRGGIANSDPAPGVDPRATRPTGPRMQR